MRRNKLTVRLIALTFWAFLCCFSLIGHAQSFDIGNYSLSVEFKPNEKTISGTNEMVVIPNEVITSVQIQLDPALVVNSIKYKKKSSWLPLKHKRAGKEISIELAKKIKPGKSVTLLVDYYGPAREAANPPWDGGITWSKTKDGKDWIGISCQVQGASLWWPCVDNWLVKPQSMDMEFTVPAGLTCVSNGTLKSTKEKGNRTTFSWKVSNPINPYAVTANIGPFKKLSINYKSEVSGDKFPLELYYLPESEGRARAFFPQIEKQMEYLESVLGPYPFSNEKYAVIESPFHGMDHQTAVSIDSKYQNNYAGFNYLHFHELAHEWWGNKLTASWKDFWIHEGFAKFMEALYVEELKGPVHYCKFIASYYDRMLNKSPIAHKHKVLGDDVYFVDEERKVGNRDYSLKGAYALHLMKEKLGDDDFLKWLRSLQGDMSSGYLTTENIIETSSQISDYDFSDLLENLLYNAKIPKDLAFFPIDCYMAKGDKDAQLEYMTGQMLLVGFKGTSIPDSVSLVKNVRQGKVGGIIFYERNIDPENPGKSLITMADQLQKIAPMPLFVSIDEEGGKVNRLKPKYGFHSTLSATELGQMPKDSTTAYAAKTASLLSDLGINVNFAPVVDLCSNADNPVIAKIERCYSPFPEAVAEYAGAVIKSHQEKNVFSVLKHFPGHGSSAHDTHLGIADVTQSWTREELKPYEKLIESETVEAIMTAHIINKQLDTVPATLSYRINQRLLRDTLGFKGLLFSDDLQMKAISKHYSLEQVLTMAVNSGVDVLMFSHNIAGTTDYSVADIHQTLVDLVKQGAIPRSRIEESYQRILSAKMRWALAGS